jgi:hypothetical protein
MTLTQRDARIDDADHRLRQTRQLRRQTVMAADRVSLYPTKDGGGTCGTSRQSKTHNIESREVRYPWHPWHGRTVWIYQSLNKHGIGILRCRTEQDQRVSLLELPEWMFDTAAGEIQLAKTAVVRCEALRDLKVVLQQHHSLARRDSVIESQHQSLQSSGGADVQATEPTQVYSTETIPPETQEPSVGESAGGNSTENRKAVSTAIEPTFRKSARLQRQKGGTR